MKTLLISVGTRGDIEPFLAIAEILQERGHEVTCCFPEQFRELANDSNFKFVGLTPQYLQMLESKEGIIAMGGKGTLFQKIRAYYVLYKRASVINKIMCKEQKEFIEQEQPDKIVHHIKAAYPLVYETIHPNKTVLISPIPYVVHPLKDHAHIGFKNMGTFINKLSYRIANYGILKNIQTGCDELYDKKKFNAKKIISALSNEKTVYTISPFLFKASQDWSANVKILGYHERNKTLNWKPDDAILNFLKKHTNIVFVTFGSMVNATPQKKTELIIKVLEKLNVPAIINTGSGGLVKLETPYSTPIHYVSNIPYDWLLPQVDYMVHHGGSGTTHMAMKYGCPSVIIPHIIDQFLWNEINNKEGLGPKGVSINRLTNRNFETLLSNLISNHSYKEKALEVSTEIMKEDFKSELYDFLTSMH